MIYDSFIMTAVVDELNRTLTGGKIERITQPEPLDVVLRVFTTAGKLDLLICCDAEHARVHVTSVRRENPPQPYAFCMLLRKYVDGARIVDFDQPSGFADRILTIGLRAHDGAPFTLIAEIMGRHSNMILIDGPGTILGAAKHITGEINRYREILPGLQYRRPPKQLTKRNPLEQYVPATNDILTVQEAEIRLVKTFAGVSPLLAHESVVRGKILHPDPADTISMQDAWDGLNDALKAVRDRQFTPIVWSDDTGNTLGAYPIELRSVPARNQYLRQSMSVALDQAASSVKKRESLTGARDSLTAAINGALKQRREELVDVERGIANAARAEEYQQSGDLLQANQHLLDRGETTVTVNDYYADAGGGDGSATRTITVDPSLTWRENAERYYKKAAKARASRSRLEERRLTLHEDLGLLERVLSEMSEVTGEDQIEDLHQRVGALVGKGRRGRAAEASTQSGPEPPRFAGYKIRAFHSVDGWEILVGENATSNDFLTTKVAASSDIWLHVRAATSAHGVIRAQNRPASVSAAALRHAAELVAARSEVKHSSLIPVDYTLKKYVRKPRKSAPGSVTYQNEKTIYVNGIG